MDVKWNSQERSFVLTQRCLAGDMVKIEPLADDILTVSIRTPLNHVTIGLSASQAHAIGESLVRWAKTGRLVED